VSHGSWVTCSRTRDSGVEQKRARERERERRIRTRAVRLRQECAQIECSSDMRGESALALNRSGSADTARPVGLARLWSADKCTKANQRAIGAGKRKHRRIGRRLRAPIERLSKPSLSLFKSDRERDRQQWRPTKLPMMAVMGVKQSERVARGRGRAGRELVQNSRLVRDKGS
jgi:hypothetical protein